MSTRLAGACITALALFGVCAAGVLGEGGVDWAAAGKTTSGPGRQVQPLGPRRRQLPDHGLARAVQGDGGGYGHVETLAS